MTDGKGDINQYTLEELKKLTLKNSSEKIPTLQEVLTFVKGKTPLLIEIKDHKKIGESEQKIARLLNEYDGLFAIQTFNPFIAKWFKQNTSFCTGILSCFFCDVKLSWYKKIILKNLWLAKNVKSDFISYEATAGLTFKKLKKLKGKIPVLFWTIRNQSDADKCKQVCDNIIFEGFLPK